MERQNRYPGYRVLEQRGHWDNATRRVVLDRDHNVPPFRHFDQEQQLLLNALCDRIIPQDDKPQEWRVPIAPWIDAMAGSAATDGFRYEDLPPVQDAWKRGFEGLDETSRELFGLSFVNLSLENQDKVLSSIRNGNPPGETWKKLPARRWWKYIVLRHVSGVYYAHPYAWDEIGYGGPAYPRGYMALSFGNPEPWEVDEEPDRL